MPLAWGQSAHVTSGLHLWAAEELACKVEKAGRCCYVTSGAGWVLTLMHSSIVRSLPSVCSAHCFLLYQANKCRPHRLYDDIRKICFLVQPRKGHSNNTQGHSREPECLPVIFHLVAALNDSCRELGTGVL